MGGGQQLPPDMSQLLAAAKSLLLSGNLQLPGGGLGQGLGQQGQQGQQQRLQPGVNGLPPSAQAGPSGGQAYPAQPPS